MNKKKNSLFVVVILLVCSFSNICFVGAKNEMLDDESIAIVLNKYDISKLKPEQTQYQETVTRYSASLLLTRLASRISSSIQHNNDCNFTDISSLAQSDANEIKESCELGLFKGSHGLFRPDDIITWGESLTVIARMLLQDGSITQEQAFLDLLGYGLIDKSIMFKLNSSMTRRELNGLMYNIIIGISQNTLFSQFTITNGSQSINSDKTKEVLQIITYQKNKIFGNYQKVQKGSAVYLGDNLLVTNAHVVLDDNDNPTHLYEVCHYNLAINKTECRAQAKLLQYNKDEDLALLRIQDDTSLGFTASTFANNAPKSNDSVTVYGFPGIGGNSITVTKGIISGIETEQYKSDVKIDHGNSGGGAYNKKGELLGIPSSIRSDSDSLSYIIPFTKVQKFLKSQGNIVTIKDDEDTQLFEKYLTTLQFVTTSDGIKNPAFSFKKPNGWNIVDYSFSQDQNLYSVELVNSNETIQVSINNGFSTGSSLRSSTSNANNLKDLENYCNTIVTGSIVLQGKEFDIFECQELFGETNTIKTYNHDNNNSLFNIEIAQKTNDKSMIAQVDDLLQGMTFETLSNNALKGNYGNIVDIPLLPQGTLYNTISIGGSISLTHSVVVQDKELNLTPYVTNINNDDFARMTKNKSFKDLMVKKENSFFKEYYDTVFTGTIIKTNNNYPFYFDAKKDNKDKLEEGEESNRSYEFTTYIEYNEKNYLLNLHYSYEGEKNTVFDTMILQHVNAVTIGGTFPIANIGMDPVALSTVILQP